MFMHIGGMGDEATLAAAVGKVFAKIRETKRRAGRGAARRQSDPAKSALDTKAIDAVLGSSGDLKDGVYKVVLGRETAMHGDTMGSTMGVNPGPRSLAPTTTPSRTGISRCSKRSSRAFSRRLRGANIERRGIHQHMTANRRA